MLQPKRNKRLPREFYQRDTIQVARDLLGKELVRILPDGQKLSGIILETEAYLGLEDPACHSYGMNGPRRTARTEVMFHAGGFAYIYFIYGMHFCFNAVTMRENEPEAVLIRALFPATGFLVSDRVRLNGPGKLCRLLQIDRSLNGHALDSTGELFILEGVDVSEQHIETTSRIGIAGSGDAAEWPLRFVCSREFTELLQRLISP